MEGVNAHFVPPGGYTLIVFIVDMLPTNAGATATNRYWRWSRDGIAPLRHELTYQSNTTDDQLNRQNPDKREQLIALAECVSVVTEHIDEWATG